MFIPLVFGVVFVKSSHPRDGDGCDGNNEGEDAMGEKRRITGWVYLPEEEKEPDYPPPTACDVVAVVALGAALVVGAVVVDATAPRQ